MLQLLLCVIRQYLYCSLTTHVENYSTAQLLNAPHLANSN